MYERIVDELMLGQFNEACRELGSERVEISKVGSNLVNILNIFPLNIAGESSDLIKNGKWSHTENGAFECDFVTTRYKNDRLFKTLISFDSSGNCAISIIGNQKDITRLHGLSIQLLINPNGELQNGEIKTTEAFESQPNYKIAVDSNSIVSGTYTNSRYVEVFNPQIRDLTNYTNKKINLMGVIGSLASEVTLDHMFASTGIVGKNILEV